MTGYFGLLNTGRPEAGETVVISGADKCKYLVDELGFDSAIDYKSEDLNKALRTHCPKGIDVFDKAVHYAEATQIMVIGLLKVN